MAQEDFDRAAGHFRLVQSLEQEVGDAELLAIANFWTGRCLRKGRPVRRCAGATSSAARGWRWPAGIVQMAAIMQASRSWLAFQKGQLSDAATILRGAEEALSAHRRCLSRGNIQSAYGRIARRQGRYERALEYFERAIGEYRSGAGNAPATGASLVNMAFVNDCSRYNYRRIWTTWRPRAARPESRAGASRAAAAGSNEIRARGLAAPGGGHGDLRGWRGNHRGIAGRAYQSRVPVAWMRATWKAPRGGRGGVRHGEREAANTS